MGQIQLQGSAPATCSLGSLASLPCSLAHAEGRGHGNQPSGRGGWNGPHRWGTLGVRLRLPLCLQCALDSPPVPGRNWVGDPLASASEGPSGPLTTGLPVMPRSRDLPTAGSAWPLLRPKVRVSMYGQSSPREIIRG